MKSNTEIFKFLLRDEAYNAIQEFANTCNVDIDNDLDVEFLFSASAYEWFEFQLFESIAIDISTALEKKLNRYSNTKLDVHIHCDKWYIKFADESLNNFKTHEAMAKHLCKKKYDDFIEYRTYSIVKSSCELLVDVETLEEVRANEILDADDLKILDSKIIFANGRTYKAIGLNNNLLDMLKNSNA